MPRATRGRIVPGNVVDAFMVETVTNEHLAIPAGVGTTHLQFRRFAGCPVCTLHLRSFIRRHSELVNRGIHEVAVFNSSRKALLEYHADVPFALIPDPGRVYYRQFGLGRTLASVLRPAAWPAIVKGALAGRIGLPEKTLTAFELPADFLLAPDGTVVACKYGQHADDQWSVDEVISLSGNLVKPQ